MTCAVCRSGKIAPGKATVTLTRGGTTVVIRDTPADVCAECGEYYLSEEVTRAVLATADAAAQRKAEVEILSFAAWARRRASPVAPASTGAPAPPGAPASLPAVPQAPSRRPRISRALQSLRRPRFVGATRWVARSFLTTTKERASNVN